MSITPGHSKIVFLFGLSLLLAYGSDWAPYYFRLFYGSKMKILGSLRAYSEPCLDRPKDDAICKVQYRLPSRYFSDVSDRTVLGLGIILQPIEVICSGSSSSPILLGSAFEAGRVMNYFNIYQRVALGELKCNSDILLKNWIKPKLGIRRFGIVQSPVVLIDRDLIGQLAKLIEFFQGPLATIFALIFLTLSLSFRLLLENAGDKAIVGSFEKYSLYWIVFNLINGGIFLDFIFPVDIRFSGMARVSNFFAGIAISGPIVNYFVRQVNVFPAFKTVAVWLEASIFWRVPNLLVFLFLLLLTPQFSIFYIYFLLLIAILGLIISIRFRNLEMILFSVAIVSDVGKILMFPFLPSSRLSLIFYGCLLISSLLQRFRNLRIQDRLAGGLEVANQVAHDLRSPLAAVEIEFADFNLGDDSKRRLILSRLQKIRKITDDLLTIHRNDSKLLIEKSSVCESFDKSHFSNEFNDGAQVEKYLLDIIGEVRISEKNVGNIRTTLIFPSQLKDRVFNFELVNVGRVITNLLRNSIDACRANPVAHIFITVASFNDSLVISVADNGSGIPTSTIEKIGSYGFSLGKTDLFSGSGLGLYSAKKLMRRMGGFYKIDSIQNIGTVISIGLPANVVRGIGESNSKLFDHFLLEDDSIIRDLWAKSAQKKSINLNVSASLETLLSKCNLFHDRCNFYIDVELEGELPGELIAYLLLHLGIKKVWLATGFDSARFSDLSDKIAVMGKTPPWLSTD